MRINFVAATAFVTACSTTLPASAPEGDPSSARGARDCPETDYAAAAALFVDSGGAEGEREDGGTATSR